MKVRNQEDFFAGLMFMAFGALFLVVGSGYPRGDAGNMGPGYVPVALGAIVIVLGAAIAAAACRKGSAVRKLGRIDWLLVLLIPGSVILFGVLLPYLGLVLSLLVVIGLSSFASHEFSWWTMLANAAALVTISWVIFIWALRLPFPVWPPLLAG